MRYSFYTKVFKSVKTGQYSFKSYFLTAFFLFIKKKPRQYILQY